MKRVSYEKVESFVIKTGGKHECGYTRYFKDGNLEWRITLDSKEHPLNNYSGVESIYQDWIKNN